MELPYRLQSSPSCCNTSAISDLDGFVVGCRFLGILMLYRALSRYCACEGRAVPLLSIDWRRLTFFCEEANRPANSNRENHKVTIEPAGHPAVKKLTIRNYWTHAIKTGPMVCCSTLLHAMHTRFLVLQVGGVVSDNEFVDMPITCEATPSTDGGNDD